MDMRGIGIGVGVVVAGGWLAIGVPMLKSRSLAEYNAWGQPVTAEVVGKHSHSRSSGSRSNRTTTRYYYLNYSYIFNGKRYCHKKIFSRADKSPAEFCEARNGAEVNERTYETYFVGDAIEIRFNPDVPAESHPVMVPDNGQLHIWGGFLALCGALVIWSSLRQEPKGELG